MIDLRPADTRFRAQLSWQMWVLPDTESTDTGAEVLIWATG